MPSHYKRGKTYWIQYTQGGKRCQESLKTTDRGLANYYVVEKAKELSRMPLDSFADPNKSVIQILGDYAQATKSHKKETVISEDVSRVKKFLTWANIDKLKNIQEKHARDYFEYRFGQLKAPEKITKVTANNILKNIKAFLNWSVREGYLAYSPLRYFQKYKVPHLPVMYLNKAQIGKILKASTVKGLHAMVATAIYTGMRLSELKRLSWDDIDFNKRLVTVRISKTGRFRLIPLHKDLSKVLRPLKGNGLCFDCANLRRRFRRIRTIAKLPWIGWHTFRHTFASQLVQAGVSLYKVSKYLGHSTIKTTEIYAHLSPSEDVDIDKFKL